MIPPSRASPSCTLATLPRAPKTFLPPLVLLAGLLLASHARADEPGVPAALMVELAKEAPGQVEVFRRGAKAERDKPQRAVALSLFAEVAAATTRFSEASRRACELALELGKPATARAHCERAVARARSSANLISLALVNATPAHGVPADAAQARALVAEALSLPGANWWTQAEVCTVEGFLDVPAALRRASQIPTGEREIRRTALQNVMLATYRARDLAGAELVARELEAMVPDLSGPWRNAAIFALERGDAAALHRGAQGLGRLRPPAPDAGYYDALAYELEGKLTEARASLRTSERNGFSSSGAKALRTRLASQGSPEWTRVGGVLVVLVAGWGLLVALFTKRAAAASRELMTAIAGGRPVPRESDLPDEARARRHAYSASLSTLLWLLVPMRFLAGLVWTSAALLAVPLVARFVFASHAPWELWAMAFAAASIAVVTKTPEPASSRGPKIALDEHPALAAMLDDIGQAAGLEPIHDVRLVRGAGLRLTLGGSLWQLARGQVQPRLELGLDTLRSLDQQAFRTMLVQTLACLATEELRGTKQALAARVRLHAQLTHRGAWGSLDLARPLVWIAERSYRRASFAAVRYQELCGDQRAVAICGFAAFERGIRVLTGEGAVPSEAAHLASVPTYRTTPVAEDVPWDEGRAPYDAAPSVAERLARARQTPRREGREDVDDEARRSAWRLFSRRKELAARVLGG